MDFRPGDLVRIKRDWWDELEAHNNMSNDYVRRGPDFIYTIKAVEDFGCYLVGGSGSWDIGEDTKLELAVEDGKEIKPDVDTFQSLLL